MTRWLAAALLCCGVAQAAAVHSLDQVPSRLATPEGRAQFAQQINGDPAPDLLGARHLPEGLSAAVIAGLLAPGGGQPSLVGARHWHDDLYVAIACIGGAPASGAPQCAYPDGSDPTMQVRLGVIAMPKGAPPRLVAASGDWDARMGWDRTELPGAPQAADGAAPVVPQEFTGFDLANYLIAPGVRAFGLRGVWQEGYSGGGASYTGLYLFVPDGERLRLVLAAPMSVFKDIAGDWHKDGTRDHDITDVANLLVVLRHRTAGHFDLELRQRPGTARQVWRWDAGSGAYRP
jgi:hypothetical protein